MRHAVRTIPRRRAPTAAALLISTWALGAWACGSGDTVADGGDRGDASVDGGGNSTPDGGNSISDTGVDPSPPVPGTWSGTMVGELNGTYFAASLVLTVDAQNHVQGEWLGTGLHDGWRGAVTGSARTGALDCPPNGTTGFLCVSMTEPYWIQVPAALVGALTPTGGQGTWQFQVYAAGLDGGGGGLIGDGTWSVE